MVSVVQLLAVAAILTGLLLLSSATTTECEVTEWSQWSSCYGNCLLSMRSRNRDVTKPAFPEIRNGKVLMEQCPPLYQVQQCVVPWCELKSTAAPQIKTELENNTPIFIDISLNTADYTTFLTTTTEAARLVKVEEDRVTAPLSLQEEKQTLFIQPKARPPQSFETVAPAVPEQPSLLSLSHKNLNRRKPFDTRSRENAGGPSVQAPADFPVHSTLPVPESLPSSAALPISEAFPVVTQFNNAEPPRIVASVESRNSLPVIKASFAEQAPSSPIRLNQPAALPPLSDINSDNFPKAPLFIPHVPQASFLSSPPQSSTPFQLPVVSQATFPSPSPIPQVIPLLPASPVPQLSPLTPPSPAPQLAPLPPADPPPLPFIQPALPVIAAPIQSVINNRPFATSPPEISTTDNPFVPEFDNIRLPRPGNFILFAGITKLRPFQHPDFAHLTLEEFLEFPQPKTFPNELKGQRAAIGANADEEQDVAPNPDSAEEESPEESTRISGQQLLSQHNSSLVSDKPQNEIAISDLSSKAEVPEIKLVPPESTFVQPKPFPLSNQTSVAHSDPFDSTQFPSSTKHAAANATITNTTNQTFSSTSTTNALASTTSVPVVQSSPTIVADFSDNRLAIIKNETTFDKDILSSVEQNAFGSFANETLIKNASNNDNTEQKIQNTPEVENSTFSRNHENLTTFGFVETRRINVTATFNESSNNSTSLLNSVLIQSAPFAQQNQSLSVRSLPVTPTSVEIAGSKQSSVTLVSSTTSVLNLTQNSTFQVISASITLPTNKIVDVEMVDQVFNFSNSSFVFKPLFKVESNSTTSATIDEQSNLPILSTSIQDISATTAEEKSRSSSPISTSTATNEIGPSSSLPSTPSRHSQTSNDTDLPLIDIFASAQDKNKSLEQNASSKSVGIQTTPLLFEITSRAKVPAITSTFAQELVSLNGSVSGESFSFNISSIRPVSAVDELRFAVKSKSNGTHDPTTLLTNQPHVSSTSAPLLTSSNGSLNRTSSAQILTTSAQPDIQNSLQTIAQTTRAEITSTSTQTIESTEDELTDTFSFIEANSDLSASKSESTTTQETTSSSQQPKTTFVKSDSQQPTTNDNRPIFGSKIEELLVRSEKNSTVTVDKESTINSQEVFTIPDIKTDIFYRSTQSTTTNTTSEQFTSSTQSSTISPSTTTTLTSTYTSQSSTTSKLASSPTSQSYTATSQSSSSSAAQSSTSTIHPTSIQQIIFAVDHEMNKLFPSTLNETDKPNENLLTTLPILQTKQSTLSLSTDWSFKRKNGTYGPFRGLSTRLTPSTTSGPHQPCAAAYGNRRCCRVDSRMKCPNGKQAQTVMRWYRVAGQKECSSYTYGYCGLDTDIDEQPIKYEQECYDICYSDIERQTLDVFRDLQFENGLRIKRRKSV